MEHIIPLYLVRWIAHYKGAVILSYPREDGCNEIVLIPAI